MIVAFAPAHDTPASAHAPHDQVTDVDFSVDFEQSGVVHAIVRGHLMRSEDGGESWREIVRGLGGEAQKVARMELALSDAAVAYVTTGDGAVLRSADGGMSWETVSDTGFAARELSVSPVDADDLLVVGGGFGLNGPVARSRDGGQTWTAAMLPERALGAWQVEHHDDGTHVIAVGTNGQTYLSEDRGATWAEGLPLDIGLPRDIAIGPGSPDEAVVFITGDDGVRRSTDGGASYAALDGLPEDRVNEIIFAPGFSDDGLLWGVTIRSGPIVSRDAGDTWDLVDAGLTRSPQAVSSGAADFAAIAIAPDGSGRLVLGGFAGVFIADDGDDSWLPIETLDDYITGLAVSPDHAEDSTIAIFTYVKGAFLSTDRGETWSLISEGLGQPTVDEGNQFAPLRRLHNVHISPGFAQDQTLYGATWTRVVRSTDAGAHWESIEVGDRPDDTSLRQFVLALSRDFATDGTLWAATRQGELYRSGERGDPATWELLHRFDGRVRSVAPAADAADGGDIYVGTVGALHRSSDGGATFESTGVANRSEVSGSEVDFGIQVVLSPSYEADGYGLAGTDHGLYETRDHGEQWSLVSGPGLDDDTPIEAIGIAPTVAEGGPVLVSVRGVGVLRSTDGGRTFEVAGESLVRQNLLIADYSNPSSSPIQFSPTYAADATVYAYAQTSVVRSTDGGITWAAFDTPTGEEVLAALEGDTAIEPAPEDTTTTTPSTTSTLPTSEPGDETADADTDDGNGLLVAALVLLGLAVVGGGVVAARSLRSRLADDGMAR
ncbi:MAG: hypothetical protein DHS20C19_07940 [Acidimicrobiales bacterium]|nr:MAG: hypothetical protein DHS20C19_07940 [Acidimicrobiales bacterium]